MPSDRVYRLRQPPDLPLILKYELLENNRHTHPMRYKGEPKCPKSR